MGKDKTPTTRSDQSKSAVAIAANATVVRKSVRRPRPTPVGGAGIDVSPEAFCCCVFHGVKSRETTPSGENIVVAYLLSHLERTRFFPKLSAVAFSDHWTSTPRVCPRRLRPLRLRVRRRPPARCWCHRDAEQPAGCRIVGQRKVLNGVRAGQCELHTFPICRVHNVRRRSISGHLELGHALTQRGQHARRVRLRLNPAGAVDICEQVRRFWLISRAAVLPHEIWLAGQGVQGHGGVAPHGLATRIGSDGMEDRAGIAWILERLRNKQPTT
jgi:hypothetical protein